MLFLKNPAGLSVIVLISVVSVSLAAPDSEGNQLAGEKSPYLLQHKDQPVHWLPWGEEAFVRARRENKPVFLSIGYAACHWCHVMARESFADPKVAALLNKNFITVKVDREERPDIDRIYMAFVQATTGSGGWPLNLWLTPEGEPFFGGLYYPPEERHGLPAFAAVAERVARQWKEGEAAIRTQGGRVLAALQKAPVPAAISDQALERAYSALIQDYDTENGGFGAAPKFPATGPFIFLLSLQAVDPKAPASLAAREMTLTSLKKIAAGGIRDHLGGGFHRYAVDQAWQIPHFEKMLSDQALLAMAFLEAWQVTADPEFAKLTRETLDFVLREMALPGGGFASSLEAESATADGVAEGAHYVWTAEEIDRVLEARDAGIFKARHGIEPDGNVPVELDPTEQLRRQNILYEKQTLPEIARLFQTDEVDITASLSRSRSILQKQRSTRPKPRPDDKVITAWNALMISALSRAGAILDIPRYREEALRTSEFLQRELTDPSTGALCRSWRQRRSNIPAFAEDYAFLIQALLDVYETTANVTALRQATSWQKIQDALFWDETGGGYFDTPAADAPVKVRLKNDRDGAEPTANSVSARNLLRLARLHHDDGREKQANQIFPVFGATLQRAPSTLPVLLAARQIALAPPRQAVIAGDPSHPETQSLARAVLGTFAPGLVLLYAQSPPPDLARDTAAALAAMTPIDGKPALYFCENFICRPPVTDSAGVRELLLKR